MHLMKIALHISCIIAVYSASDRKTPVRIGAFDQYVDVVERTLLVVDTGI